MYYQNDYIVNINSTYKPGTDCTNSQPGDRKEYNMTNEEYRKYINEMVIQIHDNIALKIIFLIAHKYFVGDWSRQL